MRNDVADYDKIEMRVKKAIDNSGIAFDNEDAVKKFIIEIIGIASDVGSYKAIVTLNDSFKGAF